MVSSPLATKRRVRPRAADISDIVLELYYVARVHFVYLSIAGNAAVDDAIFPV